MNAASVPPADPELEVVQRARRGDVRAWGMVVRRHQETVFRVAYLMTGDGSVAAETTRATLTRAYHALHGHPLASPVRPWLIDAVATAARAQRRALVSLYDRDARPFDAFTGPRLPASRLPGMADAATLPPDLRERLRSGFEKLTWDDRLTLAARYMMGLPRPEAATVLKSGPDEVEGFLQAALERLRTATRDPRLAGIPGDRLGALAIATALTDVPWTPDVAPMVTDRLLRDAIAYPEHFSPSQRPQPVVPVAPMTAAEWRSPSDRSPTNGRRPAGPLATTAVLGLVVVLVLALVPGSSVLVELGERLSAQAGQAPLELPSVEGGIDQLDPTFHEPASAVAQVDIAQAPRLSIAADSRVSRNAGRVQVHIHAAEGQAAARTVAAANLVQRRVEDGRWESLAAPDGIGQPQVSLAPGRPYTFRVIPSGEVDVIDPAWEFSTTLVVRDSDASGLEARGTSRRKQRTAIGGSVLVVGESTTIRTSFNGRSVALVGTVGPSSGVLMVSIDGEPWQAQDLAAPERSPRRVIMSRELERGRHTLEIGAAAGQVAVDAVLILR